jgi:hypothetical protein
MTLPYEWLIALKNTRAVMAEIVATKKIRVDEDLRKKVRSAMKHLPHDMDMSQLISTYEKNMAEWAKPEAQDRNYIVIGRFDPVQYSPEDMGWVYWDETWANKSRVYADEEKCRAALMEYVKKLEAGEKPAPKTTTKKKTTKKPK